MSFVCYFFCCCTPYGKNLLPLGMDSVNKDIHDSHVDTENIYHTASNIQTELEKILKTIEINSECKNE